VGQQGGVVPGSTLPAMTGGKKETASSYLPREGENKKTGGGKRITGASPLVANKPGDLRGGFWTRKAKKTTHHPGESVSETLTVPKGGQERGGSGGGG